MKSEVVRHIRQLRSKGYTKNDVARLAGVTVAQVEMETRKCYGNREPDETQVIDGELIGDRIRRITAEIRAGYLVIRQEDYGTKSTV